MSIENGDLEERLRRAVEGLPEGLRTHILRVEHESMWLADRHEVDPARTSLAALGHDLVRHLKGQELLAMASLYGLKPDEIEVLSPILTHGPIAAQILTQDYACEDVRVVEAVVLGEDLRSNRAVGEDGRHQLDFVGLKAVLGG